MALGVDTHAYTHIQSDFKKPGARWPAPGLIKLVIKLTQLKLLNNMIRLLTTGFPMVTVKYSSTDSYQRVQSLLGNPLAFFY